MKIEDWHLSEFLSEFYLVPVGRGPLIGQSTQRCSRLSAMSCIMSVSTGKMRRLQYEQQTENR